VKQIDAAAYLMDICRRNADVRHSIMQLVQHRGYGDIPAWAAEHAEDVILVAQSVMLMDEEVEAFQQKLEQGDLA
jgi:hypothetical protein